MAHALELLDRFAEIGATVRPADNNHLVVRAGAKPVPAMLIRQLREAKAEILAALAPVRTAPHHAFDEKHDAAWWRREFHVRTAQRLISRRTVAEAEVLAWGDLVNRWHTVHSKRTPSWQCAGCGGPIGGLPALDLGDGNRVHLEPLQCLIGFGKRWRGEATRALRALGLKQPEGVDKIDEGGACRAGAQFAHRGGVNDG